MAQFMHGLKLAGVELDRKVLADIAMHEGEAFKGIVAQAKGSVHPVSQVMDELAEIFADLGFAVATGPEIEDDWHNFTALNMPETHPGARDARHLLFPGQGCGRPRDAAAHAHLAGADPHHASRGAADPHHRAGPGLSQRLATRPTRRCSTRSKGW
jgi:hypothetical protein